MRIARTHSLVALLGLATVAIGCDDTTGPPAPGAIMVEVDAEGTDAPQSGYRAAVDNGPTQSLDLASLRTFTNIEPGAHTVRLEGLAANCAVVGQNPMTVQVVSNQTAVAQFNVECVGHVGTVRVTTVTTGDDQDPNGYLVMVDGVQRATIGVNAAVAISDVRVGLHAISLGDVAPNCTVGAPHPANVNVAFQGTVEVLFNIQCALTGTLEVTVATTGVDLDPNGYPVAVQAASLGFTGSLTVTPNGSVTFAHLRPASDYRVTLQGVALNCHVAGADVQTVAITPSAATSVEFDVSCEGPRLMAFVRDNDIYVMNSDGAGVTRLTTDPASDADPAWSSGGQIAFTTQRHSDDVELYAMNEDGTNPVRITTSAGVDDAPSWSPNGQRIVFRSFRNVNSEIYVVNADGTGLTRLTNNDAEDVQPAWSSTGKIVFVSNRDDPAGELYVMNDDGTNVVRLTDNDSTESTPAWSPDGSMIAFARQVECSYYGCRHDIFVMNSDGSGARRLETGWASYQNHTDPSWSPNGRVVAFTRQQCDYYYCQTPSIWLVEVEGTDLQQLADNAANPAWKP